MVTRRSFMTTVSALAVGVGVPEVARAAAPRPGLRISAYVGDRAVTRTEVLQWEARRIRVAASRLSAHLPAALVGEVDALVRRPAVSLDGLARDRELLADVKLAMGEERIRRLLAVDLALSTPTSRLASGLGSWSVSRARVVSNRGTARGFADWFVARGTTADERALLVACPDHYLIRDLRPGVQEVIEVTGGAMLASRFVIDYADRDGLPVAEHPDFPVRLAGWARTADGGRIGGVRHQLRDLPGGGFEARLAVAFPGTLPPWMVAEHRWHLACEFSNWVRGCTTAG